jgi:hypothetical protein
VLGPAVTAVSLLDELDEFVKLAVHGDLVLGVVLGGVGILSGCRAREVAEAAQLRRLF